VEYLQLIPYQLLKSSKENKYEESFVLLLCVLVCNNVIDQHCLCADDVKKVAIILDPVGVNPFLTQVVDKFAEVKAAGTYPMDILSSNVRMTLHGQKTFAPLSKKVMI
jgi:hypothetical protein